MKLPRASLLLIAILPLNLPAQVVELIAGWNFGQFITAGVPSTDGTTGDPVGFIPSNFTQTVSPADADSGPNHIADGVASVFSAGTGVIRFDGVAGSDAWDFSGGSDVVTVERGSFVAVNHNLVNGRQLFVGDVNNAHLRFTASAANSRFALVVSTAGCSDYDPALTSQPNDANLSFAAYAASGGSASVTWSYDGVPLGEPIIVQSGEFQAFDLDLPSAFYGRASATLVARITGDLIIDHVQVNGIRATPVTFVQDPVGRTVISGGDVSFSVSVSGAAAPTFQWRRDGVALVDGSGVSGATSATLSLTGVGPAQAGDYTVVVNNNGATATSAVGTLTVQVAPVITRQPSSASANPGDSIVFEVAATGAPAPTYQWRKGAANLTDDARVSGATTAALTLTGLVVGDAGDYSVLVFNAAGSTPSAVAVLGVTEETIAPSIQTQPVAAAVIAGHPVSFQVSASGAPAPTFLWRKDGQPLSDGPGISGSATATLTLTPASLADGGDYTVLVSNSAGERESEAATLTVYVAPVIPEGSGPHAQSATVGGSVTFSVAASGAPAPTYQWRKNGQAIEGRTDSTLTLTGLTLGDAGSYSVVAANLAGSVESPGALLTVHQAPAITTPPVGLVVAAGETATFRVVASGTPTLTYQWRKDGASIPGQTSDTLVIGNASPGDVGDYSVVVYNRAGSVASQPVRLEVAVRVVTTSGLQEHVPGTRLKLDSGFSADAGYRFQWLRSGKVISGATAATYDIASAGFGDSGAYSVRVYSAAGRLLLTRTIAKLSITVAGIYDALLRDPVGLVPRGVLRLTVAASGTFTGSLLLNDGKTYATKGRFTFESAPYIGTSLVTLKRSGGLAALELDVLLDARARSLETGLGLAVADQESELGVGIGYPRLVGAAAWAGRYQLFLAPVPPVAAGQPTTTNTLAATVGTTGAMKITGTLADATKVTGSFPSSAAAEYAVWFNLASIKGYLGGALKLVEASAGSYLNEVESSGDFIWFRAPNAKSKVYPGGIDQKLTPTLTEF